MSESVSLNARVCVRVFVCERLVVCVCLTVILRKCVLYIAVKSEVCVW